MRLSLCAAVFCAVLAAAQAASAAPAFIVVDADAGVVLGQRDADAIWHPASVTKLMTAYLTFQALKTGQLKLTSPVTVSANALAEPPSKMGYKVGTVMTVDNALKMMIVHSANDIAVALSETVGGTEAAFVARMNAQARRLGMNSTHYDNPNGLPSPGQLTNARDLAVLASALWRDYPEYRSYFGIPAIKAGRRVLRSQNSLLLRYPGTNGMKTGFICDSGFNMVATATRNGRTLMVVVLGATSAASRAETAAKLLNTGFSGGSFGFPRVALANFRSGAQPGPVADLHDQVCGPRRFRLDEDVGDDDLLGPQVGKINPVVVYTGQADELPSSAELGTPVKASIAPVKAGKPAKGMPLPRPRPSLLTGGADAGGKLLQ